jgi:hypothetical protein
MRELRTPAGMTLVRSTPEYPSVIYFCLVHISNSPRDKINGQRPTVQAFVVQFRVFSDVM